VRDVVEPYPFLVQTHTARTQTIPPQEVLQVRLCAFSIQGVGVLDPYPHLATPLVCFTLPLILVVVTWERAIVLNLELTA
jgi:hypothetical protein